jgi:hypothetical protein
VTPAVGGRAAPGLRLYGVVSLAAPGALALDGAASTTRDRLHTPPLGTPAAEVVRVRDLGAVVAPARFAAEPLSAEVVLAYRAVVEAVFAERAVLPAPPGAVFRSRAALSRWMELHAGALAEGLRFAEDRAEARVTAAGPPAAALEAFAALRREAAAMLVVRADGRPDGGSGDASSAAAGGPPAGPADEPAPLEAHAALLVDRGSWGAFADAVAREGRRRPDLHLACAGPWPPYSFVRLDFSA